MIKLFLNGEMNYFIFKKKSITLAKNFVILPLVIRGVFIFTFLYLVFEIREKVLTPPDHVGLLQSSGKFGWLGFRRSEVGEGGCER